MEPKLWGAQYRHTHNAPYGALTGLKLGCPCPERPHYARGALYQSHTGLGGVVFWDVIIVGKLAIGPAMVVGACVSCTRKTIHVRAY